MPPLWAGAQQAPSLFYLRFRITLGKKKISVPLCLYERLVFAPTPIRKMGRRKRASCLSSLWGTGLRTLPPLFQGLGPVEAG